MTITIKTFNELSTLELYGILRLRSEVFVVEQQCVYQDMDGKDLKALHIMGINKNTIVAYTRIFQAGDYLEAPSIGRVVVAQNQRQYGYGKMIMKASIKVLEDRFHITNIQLSAQCYLQKFYNELCFREIGNAYLEDGIPHILMERK